ncbi:lyase family protein, partial [Campylobacter jejuni]
RNDQVATDFKLFVKKSHIELIKLLKELIQTMLEHAKVHKKTIMPSFTHLQHAQPVSFSFYILAYAFMLMRDIKRLQNSLELADFSPLGSCACAGTSYRTNRELSAEILGFKDIM